MRRADTTLRPARKAAHATIDGAVVPRAKGARIAGLTLTSHDPVYSIPLKINADDFSLVRNDITAARNISCVLIGADRRPRTRSSSATASAAAGAQARAPLYVAHSQDAVIRGNLLIGNRGGWAVHLYPDADGTLIEGNVIDANQGGSSSPARAGPRRTETSFATT